MELPETWRFLGTMWWVLHACAIGLVFYVGYVVGKSSASGGSDEPPGWQGDAPDREDDDGSKR